MKHSVRTLAFLAALLMGGSLAAELLLPAPSAVVTVGEEPRYLLKAYEGKVARFDPAKSTDIPEEVYDIYLQYLPPYDQLSLAEGLWFENEELLTQAVFDFES